MGTLYLVSTPIGNLEDITLRALRILREVALIAAEDTRHSQRLLKHYDLHKPLLSLHEHNESARIERVLGCLEQGKDVALISDAGTPLLSDPGYQIVRACIQAGFQVTPAPGASAMLAALVASGLPTDRFLFLGFPPRKAKARAQWLAGLKSEPGVLIFYESPRRLAGLLRGIAEALGPERCVVVARELTKLYEEFWRGTAAEAATVFTEAPRGEVVVLVAGAEAEHDESLPEEVVRVVEGLLAGGMPVSEAAKLVASVSGWPRRQVYQAALGSTKSMR